MAIQYEIQFEQLPVWGIVYDVRARTNDKRLLIGKSSWNIHNVIYSRWWQHLSIICQPKTNQLWDHKKRVFSLHGNDSYNSINGEKSSMSVKHTQRGRNSYFWKTARKDRSRTIDSGKKKKDIFNCYYCTVVSILVLVLFDLSHNITNM